MRFCLYNQSTKAKPHKYLGHWDKQTPHARTQARTYRPTRMRVVHILFNDALNTLKQLLTVIWASEIVLLKYLRSTRGIIGCLHHWVIKALTPLGYQGAYTTGLSRRLHHWVIKALTPLGYQGAYTTGLSRRLHTGLSRRQNGAWGGILILTYDETSQIEPYHRHTAYKPEHRVAFDRLGKRLAQTCDRA